MNNLPPVPPLDWEHTHQGWTDAAVIKVEEYRKKILDNMFNCPDCGTLNDINANFCNNCGHPIQLEARQIKEEVIDKWLKKK